MAAWFNKKSIRKIAEMAARLKAESQARAEAEEKLKAEVEAKAVLERKVKAEAEKLLISQYNKYKTEVEEANAKVRKAEVTAEAHIKEAEEKIRSYEAALTETRERLNEATGLLKTEAVARAEAEGKLRTENEERKSVEAQIEDAIKTAEAKVEEKVQSYEAALAETQEKLDAAQEQLKAESNARAEAEEKVQSYKVELTETREKLSTVKGQLITEAFARAKAEEKLKYESEERKRIEVRIEGMIAAAKTKEEKIKSYTAALTEIQEKPRPIKTKERVKARAAAANGQVKTKTVATAREDPKIDIQERRRFFEQPVEGIFVLGQNRRNIFHLGDIRRKIVLLLVLGIFSALTFALNIANDPEVSKPGDIEIQAKSSERDSTVRSDTDREQLDSEATGDASPGNLEAASSGMTDVSSLENESSENITVEADKEETVPTPDIQSLVVTTKQETLKITASTGGKGDIVQSSDDNRLEIRVGSSIYYEFSDVSVGANAAIKSVILFVEHFEDERFADGTLEWSIGTGWPDRPAIWAAMKAPVHQGQSSESVDAWDITSVVDTAEKINSLQLQIKNNNKVGNRITLVDYAYVVIEYS